MIYIVTSNLKRNGTYYAAGSTLEADPAEVAQLVRDGVLTVPSKEAPDEPKPADKQPVTTNPASNDDADEESEDDESADAPNANAGDVINTPPAPTGNTTDGEDGDDL